MGCTLDGGEWNLLRRWDDGKAVRARDPARVKRSPTSLALPTILRVLPVHPLLLSSDRILSSYP